MADGSVTTAKLAPAAVDRAKVGDGAIGSVQLADGSVTAAKLAPGALDGALVKDGAIGTAQLADGAVTAVKLAPGSVDRAKVGDGAIGSVQLADGSVTTTKLAPGVVDAVQVGDGAIATSQLAAGSVTEPKLDPGFSQDLARLNADQTLDGINSFSQRLDLRGGIQAGDALRLDAEDGPMIVRDWTPFTSGVDEGVGRWGLFMEPAKLFLGVAGSDYDGVSSIGLGGWRTNRIREDWLTVLEGGNVGIGTNTPSERLEVNGNVKVTGDISATTFTPTSDRQAKENFADVDPRTVLAKVAALPITGWNFKEQPGIRHVGPMAQDFHAAFGLGPDDKHIATVDADGVALAAIQGLHQEVRDQQAEVHELREQNARLAARLQELEAVIQARPPRPTVAPWSANTPGVVNDQRVR